MLSGPVCDKIGYVNVRLSFYYKTLKMCFISCHIRHSVKLLTTVTGCTPPCIHIVFIGLETIPKLSYTIDGATKDECDRLNMQALSGIARFPIH